MGVIHEDGYPRRPDTAVQALSRGHIQAQRLFNEAGLLRLKARLEHLGMRGRRCCNDDGIAIRSNHPAPVGFH